MNKYACLSLFSAFIASVAFSAEYTVEFDANGGSAFGENGYSVTNQIIECGKDTRLLANVFENGGLDGMVFTGWARKANGNVEFTNCARVKDIAGEGKSVKLYAIWQSRASRAAAVTRDPVVFAGKWRANGTSITWYNENVGSSGGRFTEGYQTRVMKNITFREYENGGQNGCRLSASIGAVGNADLCTVEHGINDMGQQYPVGTFADYLDPGTNHTFFADYRRLVDNARKNNPKATIILCTPRKGILFGDYLPARWDLPGKKGYRMQDYVNAVLDVAEYEKFPVCDFFTFCGDQSTLRALSIEEALHPNDSGYQLMADELQTVIRANLNGLRKISDYKPGLVKYGKGQTITLSEPVDSKDWYLVVEKEDEHDIEGRVRIEGVRPTDLPVTIGNGTAEFACDFGEKDAPTNYFNGSVSITGNGSLILGGSKEWYFAGTASQKGTGCMVVPKGGKMYSVPKNGYDCNLVINGEVISDGYTALPTGKMITVADGGLLHVGGGCYNFGISGGGTIKVSNGGKVLVHKDSMGFSKTWNVDGGMIENLSRDCQSMIYKMNMSNGGTIIGNAFAVGSNEYFEYGYPGAHINVSGDKPCRIDCVALRLGNSSKATAQRPVQLRINTDRGSTLCIGAALVERTMKEVEFPDSYGYIKQGDGTLVLENPANAQTNGSFRLDAGVLKIARTFGGTLGCLIVNGNATVEIADGAKVAFLDSSKVDWKPGRKLTVKGFAERSFRVGENASALTPLQLSQISIEGAEKGTVAALTDDGYLTTRKGGYAVKRPTFRGYIAGAKPVLVIPGRKLADAVTCNHITVATRCHVEDATTSAEGYTSSRNFSGVKVGGPCDVKGNGGSWDEGIYFLKRSEDGSKASFWVVQDLWYGRAAAKVELTQGKDGIYAQIVKTARRSRLANLTNQNPIQFICNIDWDNPPAVLDSPAPAVKENGKCDAKCWIEITQLGGIIFMDENKAAASVNTLSGNDRFRTELLDGVSEIDVGGGAIPGPFVIIDSKAFPLTYAECNGSLMQNGVGATYGKGRVVYLGHPSYLDYGAMLHDGERLLSNSVKWIANGKAQPKIAVLRNGELVGAFKNRGFTDVSSISDASDLAGYDILISRGYRKGEIRQVLDFVKNGGGLLGTSLGWGYLFYYRDADFANDFLDNAVIAEFGFIMGKQYSRRIDGSYPAEYDDPPRGMTVDEALEMVNEWDSLTDGVRKQALDTLAVVLDGLPAVSLPELHSRLEKVAEIPELNRLAIISRKNVWQANPEAPIAADPLAAKYPGLVREGTPKISRTIPVDLSIPRWHSTGVFAVAGDPVTITLPEGAEKLGLKVHVGSPMDDLSDKDNWKRAPLVTCEVALSKPITSVYNPFGGLVYIVVPDNGRVGELNVKIDGGVMAPWFKLGRDTNEKFLKEAAESGAPYGEIEGDEFVITLETRYMRNSDDPEFVAKYWDTVLREDRLLVSRPTRKYPERYCSDIQLSCGDLHNGYPLMGHGFGDKSEHNGIVEKASLLMGDLWGIYHEIGHNHQDRCWTPACCGEVTVNLFSCLAIEKAAGCNWRDERYIPGTKKQGERVARWISRGRGFDNWKKDYFLQLELYLRLQEAYGWDAYRKTIARYYEPGFKRPNNADDTDIFNVFIRTMSEVVNANLAEPFTVWSIPVTDETRKFCSRFPAAAASITAGL